VTQAAVVAAAKAPAEAPPDRLILFPA